MTIATAPARSAFECRIYPNTQSDLRRLTLHSFAAVPHGGLEIGGILLGFCRDGVVEVTAFEEVCLDRSRGPRFVFSSEDEQRFEDLLTASRAGEGPKPVGWFCSHTRSDLGLREPEIGRWLRHFPDGESIAIVLKPEGIDLVHAQVYDQRGPLGNEFLLSSVRTALPLVEEREPGAEASGLLAEEPRLTPGQAPAPAPTTAALTASRIGPRLWSWARAPVVLALVIFGTYFWTKSSASQIPPAPSLTLSPAGEFLVLRWSRQPQARRVSLILAEAYVTPQVLEISADAGTLVVPVPKRDMTITQRAVTEGGGVVESKVHFQAPLPESMNIQSLEYLRERNRRLEELVKQLQRKTSQ